jgi:hydrolase, P-loop family
MNVEINSLQERTYKELLRKYAGFELNPDQLGLVRAMADFLSDKDKRVFILQGCAGSGKTFLMQGVANYLASKDIMFYLIAPTGKAAKVLTTKTSHEAKTIHSQIYSFHDVLEVENKERKEDDNFLQPQVVGESDWVLRFRLRENQEDLSAVYIVDESSLIGNAETDHETLQFGSGKLLHDVLEYINPNFKENRRKVIFIGDMYQLPPVGMNRSPALNIEDIYKECPYLETMDAIQMYTLQSVVRQKQDSGVLKVATYIRERLQRGHFHELLLEEHPYDVTKIGRDLFIHTYMDKVKEKGLDQVMVIAYSNATVDIYNRLIREQLFPNQLEVTNGDRLLILRNVKIDEEWLMNGDFVQVLQVGTPIIRPVKVKEEKVNLLFRPVEIKADGKIYKVLLKETVLLSKARDLTKLERKALYTDFMIRHSEEIALASKNGKVARHQKITELLLTDIYVNALEVKYGYAITCHKSQGSEWDTVFLDCDLKQGYKNRGTFQWFYTGVTRSSNQLYLVDMPRNLAMDGGIQAYAQSGRRAITSSDVDATMSASTMTARTTASNIGMPTVMSASTEMSQGLNSVGATQTTVLSEAELRKRVSCDWGSMSVAAQQIVLHMLRALGEIPCTVTDVADHAYHAIVTLQIGDVEGRVTVFYNGKNSITRFKKIDACIPEVVFQRITTIAGKSMAPQAQSVVQTPFIDDGPMGGSDLDSVAHTAVVHSVVDTFAYPPEFEYFLKEYIQRLQKKLEPIHIGITGIENLQFNLRTTFTRGYQSAVIDIHYRAKGEIKKVGALDSMCSDEAFKDEVLSYILG